MKDLATIVAEMRALGVTSYEHQDPAGSIKVTLGPEPTGSGGAAVGEAPVGQTPELPDEAPEQVPEALKRLPAAYRSLALWGGKYPKLNG
jgi:hypothetical protein